MENSLINKTFIQYKFHDYFQEKYVSPFETTDERTFRIHTNRITTFNKSAYEEVPLELEPTIQYLNSIKDTKRLGLALELTKKYGFLHFKSHVVREKERNQWYDNYDKAHSENFPRIFDKSSPYEGEDIQLWPNFVNTMQTITKMIGEPEYMNNMKQDERFHYLEMLNHTVASAQLIYDIEEHSFKLKADSLPTAIILFIISRKNYLKSCEECSSLYFAQRNTKQFCNPTCRKRNQRK